MRGVIEVSHNVLGIPNPIDIVTGGLSSLFGSGSNPVTWVLGGLAAFIESGIAAAARSAFNQLESLVNNSAGSVSFGSATWWAAKVDAPAGLWPVMVAMASAVMLGCVLLAVIQGVLAGDPMIGLRSVGAEVPKSIFGIATVVTLTGVLVAATDSASKLVLPSVGTEFGDWFSKVAVGGGFFPSFVTVLVLLGALLTWVELVIRDGLVFLLVALSPMALAVRVWPAAAGVWRKTVELGVALIVAKFVIAVALALGADALAGSVDGSGGPSAAAMASGAGLMLMAGLSPFVLLRLMPGVEAAMAAQGISRMPVRAAMSAMSVTTSAALLARLGGAGGQRQQVPTRSPSSEPAPVPASRPLARAAALDVSSRPAVGRGGDRGLPPAPKALPRPDEPGPDNPSSDSGGGGQ